MEKINLKKQLEVIKEFGEHYGDFTMSETDFTIDNGSFCFTYDKTIEGCKKCFEEWIDTLIESQKEISDMWIEEIPFIKDILV